MTREQMIDEAVRRSVIVFRSPLDPPRTYYDVDICWDGPTPRGVSTVQVRNEFRRIQNVEINRRVVEYEWDHPPQLVPGYVVDMRPGAVNRVV